MKLKKTRKDPLYTKIYRVHRSMMNRCYSERNGSYDNYGAIGVYVDEDWHDVDNFIRDVDSLPNFSIDGILNSEIQLDKDILSSKKKVKPYYSKETCMFVTRKENCSNRTTNKEFVAIHVDRKLIKFSNNIDQFSKDNDLDVRHAWSCLNRFKDTKSRRVKVTKGWQLFFKEDYDPELILLPAIFECENIITGEVTEFRNIASYAKKLGISTTPISDCLNRNPDRIVLNKYKFTTKQKGATREFR